MASGEALAQEAKASDSRSSAKLSRLLGLNDQERASMLLPEGPAIAPITWSYAAVMGSAGARRDRSGDRATAGQQPGKAVSLWAGRLQGGWGWRGN